MSTENFYSKILEKHLPRYFISRLPLAALVKTDLLKGIFKSFAYFQEHRVKGRPLNGCVRLFQFRFCNTNVVCY